MPTDEEELVVDGIVEKLSIVGNPANGEEWMLFKSDEKDNEKINDSQEETEKDMDEEIEKTENDQDDIEESKEEKSNQSSEGGSDDVSDQTQEEEKGLEEEEKSENEESSSEESDLLKEYDEDELREALEKAQKADELEEQLDEVTDQVKKERDLRKQKEYEEIAKSEFDAVTKSADELGPIIREVDEKLDEDTAEEVKSLIKTGYEQAKEAGLYKEYGSAAKGDVSKSNFEQRVEEVRKEQDIDIHKARSQVMQDPNEPNPQR